MLLAALLLEGCAAEAYAPATADHIEVLQGAQQEGTLGSTLDSLIIARVVDADGEPVSGTEITWQVIGGAGTFVASPNSIPDLAAGSWTLGLAAGRQRLHLSSQGVDAVVIGADAELFVAVEYGVGYEFGCGLDAAHATWCWGAMYTGAGNSLQNRRIPQRIEGAPAFDHLAVGGEHVCGLATGEVWCWGMNHAGQLGNGTTSPWTVTTLTPMKVAGLPAIAALDASDDGTCALATTGSLWCWGRTAGAAPELSATAHFAGSILERIALGPDFGCVVMTGGQVACWGANDQGQLGRGTVGGSSPSLTSISVDLVATALEAGEEGACAISSHRDLFCWGRVMGIRDHGFSASSPGTPTRSEEDSPALHVSLGYFCGAIWQSPASPRLLCGGWENDIEQLPMITSVEFGGTGDLCLGIGIGGIYCKTYSDLTNGPPFDFHGTGVPAPKTPAP